MESFNKEEVFQMLQGFEENVQDPLNTFSEVPAALEEYLKYVAKTGDILYPWPSIKPFIKKKVELVLDQFHEAHPMPTQALNPPFKYDELKREILGSLDNFSGAPFTIQRLCELVTVPTKHYKRTDKFMRGLEKNVLVVTYVDEPSPVNNSGERPPTPPKSIFSVDPSYLFDSGSDGQAASSSSSSPSPSSSSSSSSSSPTASSSSAEPASEETTQYAEPEPTTSGNSQVSPVVAPSTSSSSSATEMPTDETAHYAEPEATTSGTGKVSQSIASSSSSSSSASSSSSSSSTDTATEEMPHPVEPEATTSGTGQVSQSIASSSEILLPPMNMPPQSPAPLQQLDSFATVFSSPPSTPLAVVSNMPPFESTSSSSSSSSSGSSAESSPQPNSPPPGLFDGAEQSIFNTSDKPDESSQ